MLMKSNAYCIFKIDPLFTDQRLHFANYGCSSIVEFAIFETLKAQRSLLRLNIVVAKRDTVGYRIESEVPKTLSFGCV